MNVSVNVDRVSYLLVLLHTVCVSIWICQENISLTCRECRALRIIVVRMSRVLWVRKVDSGGLSR